MRKGLRRARRAMVGGTTFAVAAVLGAAPALAHIDPEPKEAPAGSAQSVGFTVEHGCDGSPTVQLDMRLPVGVTEVAPEPPAGWTGSLAGDVITFVGGPLPDDVEGTFGVRMTLPATPGATVYFPFVQRCEVGEIRWIDVPDDGSSGEEPAPAMLLLEPLPTTATTTVPSTTTATTTTPATTSTMTTAVTTTTGSTTTAPTTTSSPSSSSTTSTSAPPTTTTRTEDASTGNSSLPMVIAGVAAGGIALGGLVTWQVRRRP